VELSPEYLETLDDGEHTLTVRYDDGEASCKFTTESAGASWLWLLVLLLILLAIVGSGLMFFFIYKKKEEKNAPVNPA
jgi:flagellar basal body-associated protein FliL